jgi:uncharacterized protein (TIGR02452 family)
MITVGSYVTLTEEIKAIMRAPCARRGYHFEHGTEEFCIECSTGHVEEFGNSIGKVLSINEFNEAEVNWLPGKLHYQYNCRFLQRTNLKGIYLMIKRNGVEVMNTRTKNVSIAKETLNILKEKRYSIKNKTLDISATLDAAIKNTKLYAPEDSFHPKNNLIEPVIEITNETTAAAGRRLLESGLENVVALNFASARNVGGGFLAGAVAQEEDLCRCSGLYLCTKSKPIFYNKNILCDDLYYTNHIIYSPNVPFFRDDNLEFLESPFNLSVISAPAPNVRAMEEVDEDALRSVLEIRAARILQIAIENNHENIILGAWGCGAFGNDPKLVIEVFQKVLTRYPHFKHICFAVFDNRVNTPIFNSFKEAFENNESNIFSR